MLINLTILSLIMELAEVFWLTLDRGEITWQVILRLLRRQVAHIWIRVLWQGILILMMSVVGILQRETGLSTLFLLI